MAPMRGGHERIPRMNTARSACALLLIAAVLGGCGQKGPLTLGTPPPELPAPPPAESEDEREEAPSGGGP